MAMDKSDYINKAKNVLEQPSYMPPSSDPANKYKTKLINIFKRIKKESGRNDILHKRMYPTGACFPKFYSLLKIHKKDTPHRPTVSNKDSVTFDVSKELASILQPLAGKSKQHINTHRTLYNKLRTLH